MDSVSISTKDTDKDSSDLDLLSQGESASIAEVEPAPNSADSLKFMGLSMAWPKSISFKRASQDMSSAIPTPSVNESYTVSKPSRKKYLPNFNKLMRPRTNNTVEENESTNGSSIFYESDLNVC